MLSTAMRRKPSAMSSGGRGASPVTGRSGIGASTFGTNLKAAILEFADAAATGGNGVNIHHRRAHPHARHLGVEAALVIAGIMADIGAGAAHVEADQPL